MVKPVSLGADSLLISRMAGFDSQFWYMVTSEKIQEMVEAYHHVYKEFGGVIHKADEQPISVLAIVDEPRYTEKLSNFAYGMDCAVCGEAVYSDDRTKLGKRGEVRTLCGEHLDKVTDLRKSISEAHRKVDRAIKQEIKAQAKSIRWEWRREHKRSTSITTKV
jgi:hypothetical protein